MTRLHACFFSGLGLFTLIAACQDPSNPLTHPAGDSRPGLGTLGDMPTASASASLSAACDINEPAPKQGGTLDQTNVCDDGNPCTLDCGSSLPTCTHKPAPLNTPCPSGPCIINGNTCNGSSCSGQLQPAGTVCHVNSMCGQCDSGGSCQVTQLCSDVTCSADSECAKDACLSNSCSAPHCSPKPYDCAAQTPATTCVDSTLTTYTSDGACMVGNTPKCSYTPQATPCMFGCSLDKKSCKPNPCDPDPCTSKKTDCTFSTCTVNLSSPEGYNCVPQKLATGTPCSTMFGCCNNLGSCSSDACMPTMGNECITKSNCSPSTVCSNVNCVNGHCVTDTIDGACTDPSQCISSGHCSQGTCLPDNGQPPAGCAGAGGAGAGGSTGTAGAGQAGDTSSVGGNSGDAGSTSTGAGQGGMSGKSGQAGMSGTSGQAGVGTGGTSGTAGSGTAGSGTAGNGTAGSGTAGNSAGPGGSSGTAGAGAKGGANTGGTSGSGGSGNHQAGGADSAGGTGQAAQGGAGGAAGSTTGTHRLPLVSAPNQDDSFESVDAGSCGCRTVASPASPGAPLAAFGLAAMLGARRRRRQTAATARG